MKSNVLYVNFPKAYQECNHPDEYEDLTEYEKNRLQEWIREYILPYQIKKYSDYHTSYSLKHAFENSDQGFYITNGMFKGAMLAAGLEPKDENQVNWHFKLSKKAGKKK